MSMRIKQASMAIK